MRMLRWVLLAPVILLMFGLFVALGGQIVHLLWNWLLPSLFGWRPITFWQALGLLALCRILFGGFGVHGGARRRMTLEERQRFWKGVRGRFGFGHAPEETPGP